MTTTDEYSQLQRIGVGVVHQVVLQHARNGVGDQLDVQDLGHLEVEADLAALQLLVVLLGNFY